jgi:flagellar hook-length control protein FliK
MPQMAIIQPTAPKTPLAGSPSTKEQGEQFSPHLENAISSNKKQQTSPDNTNKDTSVTTEENRSTHENSQLQDPENSESNPNGELIAITELTSETVQVIPELVPHTSLYTETTKPIQNSVFSQIRQVGSSINLLQNPSEEIGTGVKKSATAPGSYAILSEGPPVNVEPGVLNPTQPVATSGQNALISQLQQIIDNSSETETVSITKAGNGSTPQSIANNIHGVASIITETSELNLKGLPGPDAGGIEKAAGKPTQQLTGIRNDSQQQYYNTKTNNQNPSENNQNFQGSQRGDEFSQQTATSTPQSGPLGAAEPTNTFSQVSTIVQEATAQTASESAKPIMLPSGTLVHEDDIIQQLSKRFQLSSKQMNSRINLKLHPAELGELKIDLSLKEGSIKANVVAQSQQTLEILEKNIPKLKTMLESQGFTVDEISVTAESQSAGEFDLFDRQLFSHNDYTPTAQKKSREDEAIFTLEDSEFAAPATSSGVNVKV